MDKTTIPTNEEALNMLVELEVARWGESEREPARRHHAGLSHALRLNRIANWDIDQIDHDLAAAAKRLMTKEDRRILRQGG